MNALSPKPDDTPRTAARQRAMAAFAEATPEELAAVIAPFDLAKSAVDLRRPEAGLVMLRGRIGGDGGPFNIGEASVSRASVRLPNGLVGHAYRLGRDTATARLAAIADAMWQDAATHQSMEDRLVAPVEARLAAEAELQSRQAAATRVDFFTMVRGED